MKGEQENLFKSALEETLSDFGIDSLTKTQTGQLLKHYSMLCEWNRRVNLTRIIEPREAAHLHYADSLFGARFIEPARALLDIGSGAGFPAVPLAVIRPDLEVTALEANQKKSLFLNEAKDALSLSNFTVANERLESFDPAKFDLLTSRALDRAENVLPSVIESLRAGQRFMLYCAHDLLARLGDGLTQAHKVETYAVPQSKSRLIAIFSVSDTVGQKRIV